ncbi:MAG: hypothetical protein ACJAWL_001595 [Motiliproteus sp.]
MAAIKSYCDLFKRNKALALFIFILISLLLLVWNLESFVKKHSRFPSTREMFVVYEEKDRQSFLFLFFIAVASLISALYSVYYMGPLLYFQSISLGSYLSAAFFTSYMFNYLIRFSIYIESGGLMNPSEQYLFKLWRIKSKDVKTKRGKYKLLVANMVASVLMISFFIELIY